MNCISIAPSAAHLLRRWLAMALLGLTTLLVACGGGGGGSNDVVAPTITSHPASVSIVVGQSATFSVAADGTGPLRYQWRLNGADISGATGVSHTVAVAASASGAQYSVVVSNDAGSVTSQVATLTVGPVLIAPSITTQPVAINVVAGNSASFQVIAGGSGPLTYQWRRNGQTVAGASTASHTTAATLDSDTGALFSVVVSNAAGSATSDNAALADFGCALMTCDRRHQAEDCFSTALNLAEELQDWALSQFANGHMAWVHSYTADIAKAARCYEVAISLSGRLGANRQPPIITHSILGRYYKELGRYEEALALLESTLHFQISSSSYAYEGQTRFDLAGVYLWLGQAGRASVLLREPGESATPVVRRIYWIARARIAHVQGTPTMPLLERALAAAVQEGGRYPPFVAKCEMARCLPAHEGAELAKRLAADMELLGQQLAEWPSRAMACDALRRCGRIEESVEQAHRIMAKFETTAPFYLYAPEYWWIAAQAFEQAGDHDARDAALRRAKDWIIHTALPNVPDEFKDSFLHRNPINRAVLAAL